MAQHHFVFLPGFMCDGRLFAGQAKALRQHGHLCTEGDLTCSDSVSGIAANILGQIPGNFIPVGLSMGGIIALEMYSQAQDRISHLALLNTTYHADKAGAQRVEQLDRVRRGELSLVLRDELKPNYMHPANRSEERLSLLAKMAQDLGEEAFEKQTNALMTRERYAELLPSITCPTLVLTGSHDTLCPPALHEDMAQRIPHARLVVAPECGHLSSLEQPELVTSALLELIVAPEAKSRHTDLVGSA